MAKNKKMLFGSGENGSSDLTTNISYATPGEGYPITFGKGPWEDNTLKTIGEKDEKKKKIRFVYAIDGTTSGAIYAGPNLVSSAILSITTNATATTAASEVIVKYIDENNEIAETTFNIVDPETFEELNEKFDELKEWAQSEIIKEAENGAITVTPGNDTFSTYELGVNVDNDDVVVVDDKISVSKYQIVKVDDTDVEEGFSAQYKLMVQKPGSDELVQAGETINIFKDFFLKGAHVCTFNKKASGDDWGIDEPQPIDELGAVYAEVFEE